MFTVRRLIWLQVAGAVFVLVVARWHLDTKFGPEWLWEISLFLIFVSIPIVPFVVITLLLFAETEHGALQSVMAIFVTFVLAFTTFWCFMPLVS